MYVHNIDSKQSFGDLKANNFAKLVLKRRMTNPKDFEKLNDMIKVQENNPFHVFISDINNDGLGQRLSGYVTDSNLYSKKFEEGYFASLFQSPIKFIEKLCKDADKQLVQQQKADKFDEMFRALNI